jgi:hypothetical protein
LKPCFIAIVIVLSSYCQAQVVRQPLSVHYPGLNAYSKNFVDVFSVTSNEAALAELRTAAFGVFGERRFMLEDLNGYTAIVAVPSTSGTVGLQADYFGTSSFNESGLGFVYARKLAKAVDIGAKFNYYSVRVAGYGSASAVNFEGGAIFHLNEKLCTAVHIYNPTSSRIGKIGEEKLPFVYRLGLGYEASERAFLSIEIVKQQETPIGLNAGLQYNLHPKLFIRSGISTIGDYTYAGVGLQLGFARIDVNAAYHPQLGITPGLLLIIPFKKADKD